MNRSDILNGGATCRSLRVLGNNAATAGGTGDNVEVNGAWIDRDLVDVGQFESGKLVVNYTSALGVGETLKFSVQFQDADNASGGGAADYGDPVLLGLAATGNCGGSTEAGTFEVDVGFEGARRFVRAQITPDLSRGATDTAAWSAAMIAFGAKHFPMTAAVATVATP